MSAMQRRKGAGGEREVATILAETLGVLVARNLGQARDGGDDITLPRAGGGRFRIEVKRRREISAMRYFDQAQKAADAHNSMHIRQQQDVPIVVMREDGGPWVVLMQLTDFLPLLGGELADWVECDKCGQRFDKAYDKYGCPNCRVERLSPKQKGD